MTGEWTFSLISVRFKEGIGGMKKLNRSFATLRQALKTQNTKIYEAGGRDRGQEGLGASPEETLKNSQKRTLCSIGLKKNGRGGEEYSAIGVAWPHFLMMNADRL